MSGAREAWTLSRPFWTSQRERLSLLLLVVVTVLTLATVWLNVQFSNWNNAFYNALQAHDLGAFWHQLGVFGILAAAFIVAAVYRQYLQQKLFMRWRMWLTDYLLTQWLRPGTAYRLAAAATLGIDNPDQRIAEDVRLFVSANLTLAFGLLNAVVTLVSFFGILWHLSGSLDVPLGFGTNSAVLSIPGYMVWAALVYSALGSWLAFRLGRPLVPVNVMQQKVEADFRYGLVQVRDHAEAIALSSGEPAEQRRLQSAFAAIRANWDALIGYTKRLTWFSAGYGQLASVFPIVTAAPRYFSGALQLGGLMQTAQAFGQVQGAMSWFIDVYPNLADWRATVQRLARYREIMLHDLTRSDDENIERATSNLPSLAMKNLVVRNVDGRDLVCIPALTVEARHRLLVTGATGSGKSSLLRAIAGLSRHGEGLVQLPRGASLMFVPQRPYLPQGPLVDALTYPQPAESYSDAEVKSALKDVGLERYIDDLARAANWASVLSPGEQQRVHFARVLLQKPDWAFLDESTSALDEETEKELYRRLHSALPGITIVSVGHRSTLRRLHDEVWPIRVAQSRPGEPCADFGRTSSVAMLSRNARTGS
jgi:putative ATP-binding cassette transporter